MTTISDDPGLSSAPRRGRAPSLELLAGALLLLLFAALYLLTLDDGLRAGELAGGDLITHHYAQVQGRMSNAPGYPLYTMGGWLWFRAGRLLLGPESNPIRILSSYSTFWALAALALLYGLILEALRVAAAAPANGGAPDGPRPAVWPIAFLATAFYGLTYFFWYYAVTTEQYASSVAWTLAFVLLAFRWERRRRDRYLLGLALLTGVGLAHQVTVLATLPPLLWVALRAEPGLLRRPKLVAAAVGLMLLPLLSYAFVYIRGAQHPEWRGVGQWASTWDWFWRFVSTQQGRDELTWRLQPFFTHEFPALIWRELTWPGLLAGLLGLAGLRGRRGQLVWGAIAIYLVFCWIDRLGNWYQVIMPVYALLALGVALLADRAWLWAGRSRPAARALLLVALAVLALYRGVTVYPRADSSGRPDDDGLVPAWAILADDPPAGAAVMGTSEELLALSYVTQIWGVRPDLRPTAPSAAPGPWTEAELFSTAAALPLLPGELAAAAHFDALGPTVIAVRGAPNMEPPPGWSPAAAAYDFGDGIRLLGAQAVRQPEAGRWVVRLVWQATAPPGRDWSVSVRLTRGGAELGQTDALHPVAGAYPTMRWRAGEIVTDAYGLALPPDAAPDGVTVILYRVAEDGSFVNLGVANLPLR